MKLARRDFLLGTSVFLSGTHKPFLSGTAPVSALAAVNWDSLTPYSQVAVGWQNASSSALVNPFVTTNHRAQRGDVPAGMHLQMFTAGNTPIATQQDNEAPPYAQDGSFVSGTLSYILPDTLAAAGSAGDTIGYYAKAVAGAPNRTPKFSLATWAAANDLKIILRTNLSNLADNTSNYQVRVSDIVSAGLYDGSSTGTDFPLTSIRVDRSGPVCMGWTFKGYARRISDGAWHTTLVGKIYVTAVTLTDMLIDTQFAQPNAWENGQNPLQTVGPVTPNDQGPVIGIMELWNGSTLLKTWGGPTDYRCATIPPSSINVAANTITFPTSGNGILRTALGYAFKTTGTMPGGLVADAPYYTQIPNGSNPQTAILVTRRGFVQQVFQAVGASAPNPYAANSTVPTYDVFDMYYTGGTAPTSATLYTTQYYVPAIAGVTSTGTAPNGTARAQVDGTVTWTPVNMVFADQGTGTLTAYPLVHVFPLAAATGVDDQTTDPIWTGAGPAPRVEVQKDRTYLTEFARAFPPYDTTITPLYPNLFPFTGFSVCQPYGPQNQDGFGDNPGTPVVGWLNVNAAAAFTMPSVIAVQRNMRAQALGYDDHPNWMEDPNAFQPIVCNLGPGNVAGSYAGLGPSRPTTYISTHSGNFGLPSKWQGPGLGVNGNWYAYTYTTYCDSSHLPNLSMLPYENTGRMIFRDQMLRMALGMVMSAADPNGVHNLTIAGRTYSATWLIVSQQRGIGWGARTIGATDDVLPATDALRAYFSDVVQDGIDCGLAVIADNLANNPSRYAFGLLRWPNCQVQHWFLSIAMLGLGQECRKGRHQGYRDFTQHVFDKFYGRVLDDSVGGNIGLSGWNPAPSPGRFFYVGAVTSGQTITATAVADTTNNPGTPVPGPLTYVVQPGDTPASVALVLTTLINASTGYQALNIEMECDQSNEQFRQRSPTAMFQPSITWAAYTLNFSAPVTNVGGAGYWFAKPTSNPVPGVLSYFSNWTELMTYNMGTGWPQTNTVTNANIGYQPFIKGTLGDVPWDTTCYSVLCWAALATLAEAGISNSLTICEAVETRLRSVGGGPQFSGFVVNSPSLGLINTNYTFPNFAIRRYADQAANPGH